MSETLRELVVSLSLNSDNFTRNIKSINQQIREAESSFKLAGAGVENFERTTDGAQAKVQLLQNKLTQQQRAVEQYSRAFEAANKKLNDSYERHGELNQKLTSARAAMNRAKEAVDNAEATYNQFAATLGETDSATIAAKQNLESAKEEYESAAAEVKKLEGQLAANSKAMQNNADAASRAQTNLNNAKAAVKQLTVELKTASSKWTEAGRTLESAGSRMEKTGKSLTKVGKTLSTIATAPIVALGTTAVKASIDFESSFTSVRKTVDATEQQFSDLAAASKQMSTEVAASTTEINEVMATGGQLGIATEGLADFTRVMIDLGNSCEDLSATDAATTLAKFMNIMSTDQSKVSNIGATIVDLGNNYATTEATIMEFALRLAGAGKQVGLSEAQILGFATALSSVGINAEAGGSAFSKALVKMEVAAATGGEALEDFGRVSGMTASEFKALWDSNPAAAFQAFIEGLAQMDENGESAIAVLDEIGISEVRLRDTLLRSVNATELFTKAQQTADAAWESNTALTEEANKRYATTESRLKNLKNTAVLFGQRIGDDLNPTINSLIDGASNLLEKFMGLDEAQRMQIIQFAAVAAAAGPCISILGKLSGGIGSAISAVGKFSTAVGKAGGGISGFFSVLAKSPGVWLAVTAAVAYGTSTLLDYVTGAKAAREALNSMADAAERMKETQATTIYDTGNSDPLSRFGLSKEDFAGTADATQDWLSELTKVWSDGKNETDEEIKGFVDGFSKASDSVRDKIKDRGNLLEGLGTLDDTTRTKMEADLAQLDAWDAEIESLLKKRKNGTLTDEDQSRLNEVIKLRAELEFEYSGGGEDGYEKILSGMQAEIDRMRARGQGDNADPTLYGDTLKGLAEGRQAYNDALDASYDSQHAQIMAIEDETQRTAALAALNEQYNAKRLQGEQAYQQAVAQAAQQTWDATGMKEQLEALNELAALMGSGEFDPTKLAEWTQQMDEGKMASMVALAEQLAATGDPEAVQNLEDIRSKIQQITDLASANNLTGISEIFGEALPEEILRITAELDMEAATETWNAWKLDKETLTTTNSVNIQLNPIDQAAITTWETANSGISLTGPTAKVGVALGADWQTDLQTAFTQGMLAVYGTDGLPLTVTPEVLESLDGNDIIALAEDGTYHVIITPEVGSTEGVNLALGQLSRNPAEGTIFAPLMASAQDDIATINHIIARITEYQRHIDALKESGDIYDELGISVTDYENMQDAEITNLSAELRSLSDIDLTNIATTVSQLMSALASGNLDETTATNYKTQLQSILSAISAADQYLGTGNQVSAGIAEGMKLYGWSGDASSVASSIQAAVNSALGVNSPATTMIPTGGYVSAGISQGMTAYSFASAASSVGSSVLSAVSSELSSSTLRTVGLQAMQGLRAGIIAGRSWVVSAMRSAARAAVNAAKNELEIKSPSRVFRDEVGVMTMRGFGQGIVKESKEQARVIRNATRYLTGEAMSEAVPHVSNDNRKTYNNSTTLSFAGATFSVRSEQDVRNLAIEIATLTRHNQRGMGA